MSSRPCQICTNCVMDTSDYMITFDEKGVCDHCRTFYEEIKPNWHTDEQGKRKCSALVDEIKRAGGIVLT